MKRIYQIALVLFLIFFVVLCVYAFVKPVQAWMDATFGPPLQGAFGATATYIAESWIWQNYIVPFPNQLVIGCVFLGFPLMWLMLRVWQRKIRPHFIKGAMKDSGQYPIMTEPISAPSYPTTAAPVTTTPTVVMPPPPKKEPIPETPKEEA